MILEHDLLASLTSAQREAVTHIDGPMLVLAGPGSGKTRVITYRIAYLITQGVNPANILAITFTNKAATEMRGRLHSLQLPRGSTLCTFHSLAARLLREFADLAGLPVDFSIYDMADQKAAMGEALKLCELDSQNFPPARMLDRISGFKNKIQTPEEITSDNYGFSAGLTGRIYRAYQDILVANAAVDFDDLLMKLALLLRDQQQIRDQLNDRYHYLLVDEYQDTNHCQYQIARGLTLMHSNLFVTGDPDQSIYGWRGADIGNILAFEEDYPQTRVVRLEENFRSTPEVLDLADQVIVSNQYRREKQLFTSKPSGCACELIACRNEYEEALAMAQWAGRLRDEGLEYRDMAVFYRVNSMSRVLEEALRNAGIPYQIVRGLEFFQRREIKNMLAYLKILVNPADQVALKRIINQPARGIGLTTVNRLFDYSQSTGMNIWQVLAGVDQIPSLGSAAKAKVKKFTDIITGLQAHSAGPVTRIMKLTYEQSGLADAYIATGTDDAKNNVNELINSAVMYDSESDAPSLADYLQQIALMSDSDSYDEESGAVSLMTLHTAKGLEFPAVLIVGLEDGLIPHIRSTSSPDIVNRDKEIEEERRLLFVGMTRAKDRLTLSYAHDRTVQGSVKAAIVSRFLRNLLSLVPRSFESGEFADTNADDYEYDEPDYDEVVDQTIGFAYGQLVRHPSLGVGRIERILPSSTNARAVILFGGCTRKTLVLKYAKLERIDPADY